MKKTLIVAALLSMGVAAAPAAMASGDRDDDRHDRRPDHRHDYGHDRGRGDRDNGYASWHHQREHYWQGDRYRVNVYQVPRGYQHHHWRYGDRVPVVYRSTRYVVNDYRHYNLYAPPRGHHWVRVDNDVVLTAITTGVVAAVVYSIFQ
ncbi:MAG: RcnB family protein [Stagnimonas sp.]|nr:RcnB family protein [Stagnimonas sp.]